jgi:hypothetical protein
VNTVRHQPWLSNWTLLEFFMTEGLQVAGKLMGYAALEEPDLDLTPWIRTMFQGLKTDIN